MHEIRFIKELKELYVMPKYTPLAFEYKGIFFRDYLSLMSMVEQKNQDIQGEDYFIKNDQNKPRLSKGGFMIRGDLITRLELNAVEFMFNLLKRNSDVSLEGINAIFEFGARKYNGFNFILDDKGGLENKIDRIYNAYLRHYKQKGFIDAESGNLHEDHAGACLTMMYYSLLKYYKPFVEIQNNNNLKIINIDFDGTLIRGVEDMFERLGYDTHFSYYNQVLDKLPTFRQDYTEFMKQNYKVIKPIVQLKQLRRAICHMVLNGYKLRILTNHYAGKEIVEKWVSEVLGINLPVIYIKNPEFKRDYEGYFIDDYPFTNMCNLYLIDYPYNAYIKNCNRVNNILEAFKTILRHDNKKVFYP